MLAEPPGPYFFISIATFTVCPALPSTSFVCLPSVSCHTSTVYLPGGTFSILVAPFASVTPKNGFGMTATHPSIQLCTSQVSLMISGFSNFSVITFLNFGCALLMDGFAVEYVWMLCRMSSEFLSSTSPGDIAVTCGTNLQPCWSTVAFIAFWATLAPGTETTAFASPLLPPTTTFSITASVPHFSVSLFTLSFSTTGAPLYVTVTSTVPPPWASTGSGRWTNSATPATSAAARTTPSALRIALTPFLRPLASARTTGFSDSPRGARRRASAAAARLAPPSSARLRASVRDANHEQHRRKREDRHDRRNDETAARLRLLQPQIVPRGQRHLGPGLPGAAVPSLERDRQEDPRLERGPGGALGHERPLEGEPRLAVPGSGRARPPAAFQRHG